jgi:hypothetical protein
MVCIRCRFFLRTSDLTSTPWYLRWGKAGHFFATAIVMSAVYLSLKTADDSTLFLEDEEEKKEGKEGEEEEDQKEEKEVAG